MNSTMKNAQRVARRPKAIAKAASRPSSAYGLIITLGMFALLGSLILRALL